MLYISHNQNNISRKFDNQKESQNIENPDKASMDIESDKSDTTKVILQIEQLSEEEQRKQIAKHKRKLKNKEKEEMRQLAFGVKNIMIKDLSYDKKIFLLTDLVIDLDMFNEDQQGRPNKFDVITSWRPPVRITHEDNIIHIDLDTSIDGLSTFDEVSRILQSIPNRDAYELSQHLLQYNQLLGKYFEKNQDLMYVYNLISLDQKTKYSLNDYFEDLLHQQMKKVQEFIKRKYGENKYLSYMIKTRKRNNKVITKYGYSQELLNLLGLDSENMYRLLYQNGPLLFYSNQDKINRLKQSLSKRIGSLDQFSWCNEDSILQNQTIITFDDLKFSCDIHMIKDNLTNEQNYFIQQMFMIQLAMYDINDNIINELHTLRNHSANQSVQSTDLIEQGGIYYGLDYESQSEMFIQKYYGCGNQVSSIAQ